MNEDQKSVASGVTADDNRPALPGQIEKIAEMCADAMIVYLTGDGKLTFMEALKILIEYPHGVRIETRQAMINILEVIRNDDSSSNF
ncbi:MAG: hypothetical protein WDZ85_04045 [Candidatus Paceibacterota bacterium]